MVKKEKVEMLLNVVTDLSAEIFISLEEGEISTAKNQVEEMQMYVDAYMKNEVLRQVTEPDSDFNEYMNIAYNTLDK